MAKTSDTKTIADSLDRLRYRLRIENEPNGYDICRSCTAYTIQHDPAVRVRYDVEVAIRSRSKPTVAITSKHTSQVPSWNLLNSTERKVLHQTPLLVC